jgi:phosphate transport system ATP-binding protein
MASDSADNQTTDPPAEPRWKMQTLGLSVAYGHHPVLRGVDIGIREHEITSIIGPSGSGKSSLLWSLNRMNDLVPEITVTGRVLLDGEDIYCEECDPALLRKRVGMVFQVWNPFSMSIFENVAYGPRRHGLSDRAKLEEIVEDSLRRAALWDEVKDGLHRSGQSLSGGQQQRLVIARTLAVQPEVILMDEPASALDPISAYHIEELMLHLKQAYTIVLVTRNMFQASRVADTTAVLMDGQLIEYGPTPDIFERPRDQRTEDYIRGRVG